MNEYHNVVSDLIIRENKTKQRGGIENCVENERRLSVLAEGQMRTHEVSMNTGMNNSIYVKESFVINPKISDRMRGLRWKACRVQFHGPRFKLFGIGSGESI